MYVKINRSPRLCLPPCLFTLNQHIRKCPFGFYIWWNFLMLRIVYFRFYFKILQPLETSVDGNRCYYHCHDNKNICRLWITLYITMRHAIPLFRATFISFSCAAYFMLVSWLHKWKSNPFVDPQFKVFLRFTHSFTKIIFMYHFFNTLLSNRRQCCWVANFSKLIS